MALPDPPREADSEPFPPGFLKKLEEHERLLADQEFYILVWGSGESHAEHYAKRIAIRDYLVPRFGHNRVFMSEDDRFGPLVENHGLRTAEAIQAGSVHAVVVLDTSTGPHDELSQYGDIILGRAIAFVKHEHKNSSGFARVAHDSLKVVGYTAEEYQSCETIRCKARDFLSALRLKTLRLKALRGCFGS